MLQWRGVAWFWVLIPANLDYRLFHSDWCYQCRHADCWPIHCWIFYRSTVHDRAFVSSECQVLLSASVRSLSDIAFLAIKAEISPPHARGLLSGWTQQMIGVGFLVASLVGESTVASLTSCVKVLTSIPTRIRLRFFARHVSTVELSQSVQFPV